MAVLFFSDRCFQRHRLLGDLQDFAHPLHRHIHLCRDLLRLRLSSQFLKKLAGHADQFIDGFHHVHRDTDRTCLVCDGPGDCLTDPPGRVSTEFIAFAVIEFFHRFDQTQIALLDQIQKQHAAAHITLRDADYKTQIRLRQTFFGFLVSLLHPFRQLDLFFRAQKRHFADLLQIHTNRILDADAIRHGQIDLFHIHFIFIRQDDIGVVIVIRDPKHVNIVVFQKIQNLFKLFCIQIHIAEKITDLLILQHILFLFCQCK